jgi:hypothetical protein
VFNIRMSPLKTAVPFVIFFFLVILSTRLVRAYSKRRTQAQPRQAQAQPSQPQEATPAPLDGEIEHRPWPVMPTGSGCRYSAGFPRRQAHLARLRLCRPAWGLNPLGVRK